LSHTTSWLGENPSRATAFSFCAARFLAIGFAFVSAIISDALFIVVALTWFIPDRRMEAAIAEVHGERAR
jgi:hypothetical protein